MESPQSESWAAPELLKELGRGGGGTGHINLWQVEKGNTGITWPIDLKKQIDLVMEMKMRK